MLGALPLSKQLLKSSLKPLPSPLQQDTIAIQPHTRQFVIGPRCVEPSVSGIDYSWQTISLGPNLWLSHCPHLKVEACRDADGQPWWVLGLAISSWNVGDTPSAAIARTSTAEVPALYPYWAGRWVLISADQLHLDASGLLGCFYGRDADQQVWVSSSPALLANLVLSGTDRTIDPRSLVYEQGISWFPPPRSRFLTLK